MTWNVSLKYPLDIKKEIFEFYYFNNDDFSLYLFKYI